MNKFHNVLIVSLFFLSSIYSQSIIFEDDFSSYIAGQQLVCQNPEEWTTWSNLPCDPNEDAYISTNQSYTGTNSLRIIDSNNIVYSINNMTTGWYAILFWMYIPSGSDAYFSVLQDYDNGSGTAGLEVLFPSNGTAVVNAGGNNAVTFNIVYDTWFLNEVIIDHDADGARYSCGEFYYFWDWSLGASGTDSLNQLAGVNFYGNNLGSGCDFYIDEFQFIDLLFLNNPFSEDFESYDVGGPLACQSGGLWQTGYTSPCYSDDPYVTDEFAYNSNQSTVINYLNVLGKILGKQTTGTWKLSFQYYIPTGRSGYFAILSKYFGLQYAAEINFNSGGFGELTVGSIVKNFDWEEDTWQKLTMVFDLDKDSATALIENNEIATWSYSQGGAIEKILCGVAFRGIFFSDLMYFDNFYFGDSLATNVETTERPVKFELLQNYPNPFNPSTKIKYSIPQTSQVQIKVFDILGNEITTLVNEEKPAGNYTMTWNAANLPSGVYFYQLLVSASQSKDGKAGSFIQTRKMILLK